MELVKYKEGTEAANDGLHLPGIDQQDAETLCGHAWTFIDKDIVDDKAPTCKGCIAIAKELFINRGYTKKQVLTW